LPLCLHQKFGKEICMEDFSLQKNENTSHCQHKGSSQDPNIINSRIPPWITPFFFLLPTSLFSPLVYHLPISTNSFLLDKLTFQSHHLESCGKKLKKRGSAICICKKNCVLCLFVHSPTKEQKVCHRKKVCHLPMSLRWYFYKNENITS
jgi:hypothetical protein